MSIIDEVLFCPKCKREYENRILVGYSAIDEEEARAFLQKNKIIKNCEDCGIELLDIFLKRVFDDEGRYAPPIKSFDKNYGIYNVYLELLSSIKKIFKFVSDGKVTLSLKVLKKDYRVNVLLVLTGDDDGRDVKLVSAHIGEYMIEYGDRRNNFMLYSLYNNANVILKNIYNYIFMDDSSGFNDTDKSRIMFKLIDVEHLL